MNGGFDQLRALAGFARSPVHVAQAVHDGAMDAVLGVGLELHIERRIEIIDGGQQADDAGGNQIVEADVVGQPVVNPPGDEAHLGEMLQHQRFAPKRGIVVAATSDVRNRAVPNSKCLIQAAGFNDMRQVTYQSFGDADFRRRVRYLPGSAGRGRRNESGFSERAAPRKTGLRDESVSSSRVKISREGRKTAKRCGGLFEVDLVASVAVKTRWVSIS